MTTIPPRCPSCGWRLHKDPAQAAMHVCPEAVANARKQTCLCAAIPGACPVHDPGVILRRLAGDEDVWQMARTGDWPRPNEGDGRVRLYEATMAAAAAEKQGGESR